MEHKQNINPNDEFMQPMLQENNSIFLDCDSNKFEELLSSNKVYKGTIKTAENSYNIRATLQQSSKYINQIQNLYEIFKINNLEWHTVNCPHIYRFVDIIFDDLNLEEDILEIDLDLEEYEQYKRTNLVPLWNVSFLKMKDESFSITEDGMNYEHYLTISEQNGYLVDKGNKHYLSFKREKNKMIILSDYDKPLLWDIVVINSRDIENTDEIKSTKNFDIEPYSNFLNNSVYSYELNSNNRNLSFLSRFAILNEAINPTKGEVLRLVKLYELSKQFDFLDIQILDYYTKPIKTINFNNFIPDDIRLESYKKIMLITFKNKSNIKSLQYEKISFFTSEIQLYFPQYNCIGTLLGGLNG
ncbi:MAG: hypothetical protein FWF50_03520 [Defluviitaleaceae bacterium]|nr:hypothetical protein [Defluviitaleaceae bacterium]